MLTMPQSSFLVAAQQFMTRELISYEDELFSMLYQDIGDFASVQTTEIVSQKRRTSIYGSRGVGKTAAMQGVLYQALTSSKEVEIMPITVRARLQIHRT
jgi:Cdc6-like AAA superfamily ATPase